MKKKIIIIINHLLYLNNYLNNRSFRKIEQKYDCYYLIDNSIKEADLKKYINKEIYKDFRKKVILFFEYSGLEKKLFTILFNRVQLRNRHKFISIYYTDKTQLRFKLFYKYTNENFITGIKRFILWNIKFFTRIINLIFINKFFDEIIKKFIKTNKSISNIYKKINPDLILIPFNGTHISIFDTIRYCRDNKKHEVFLLSENWDNIFSRGMINHPHHIGLWGEQSIKVLKKHNYKNKAYALGAPRLEKYFKHKNKKYKKIYNFDYAVYFDNASPRKKDNEIFLKNVDEYIEKNKKFFKNFKLIFRPHPYTFLLDMELINFKKFKNIILDPQMKSRYTYNLPISKIRKSDSLYLIALIKNANFLVCSATSIIIEASIYYKKIILYSPKNNSYDKKNRLIDLWEHFLDIGKFRNIQICDDENKIGPLIKKFFLSKKKLNKKLIDQQRSKIIYSDKRSYGERLCDEVNKILS